MGSPRAPLRRRHLQPLSSHRASRSQGHGATFSQNCWLRRAMEDKKTTMIQSETVFNNHKTACKPLPSPLQQLQGCWGCSVPGLRQCDSRSHSCSNPSRGGTLEGREKSSGHSRAMGPLQAVCWARRVNRHCPVRHQAMEGEAKEKNHSYSTSRGPAAGMQDRQAFHLPIAGSSVSRRWYKPHQW